ncbi:MAG: YcaO-like family protein [Egibacteraceae bacterium]
MPAETSSQSDRLLDRRTGIIRRLERRALPSHLPEALRYVTASISDATRFTAWPSDPIGAGCVWWDEDAARGAAVGEAVERYCGNLVPSGLRRGSYTDLVSGGYPALDPNELALHSPEQHLTPGFPFVPLTRDLLVRWAGGRDLGTGAPLLVPASLMMYCAASVGASQITRRFGANLTTTPTGSA